MKPKYITTLSLAILAQAANGASITWGAASEFNNTSQLISGAIATQAANGGNDAGINIGGVAFENFASPTAFSQVTSQPSFLNVTSAGGVFSFASADVDLYSEFTDSADLDTILDTHVYGSGTDPLNVQLTGLMPGAQYRVQFVGAADSRVGTSTRTLDIDNGSVILNRYADLDNDFISNVTMSIGTFTADATTQDIVVINDGAGFSALVLTQETVPEPSSAALLGLGGIALLFRRRK